MRAIAVLIIGLALPLAAQAKTGSATLPKPIDPEEWIHTSDYPDAAAKAHLAGTSGFTLSVDAAGKVTSCTVTSSSGSAVLDEASCRVMMRSGHFKPARDADGVAVASEYYSKVTWQAQYR